MSQRPLGPRPTRPDGTSKLPLILSIAAVIVVIGIIVAIIFASRGNGSSNDKGTPTVATVVATPSPKGTPDATPGTSVASSSPMATPTKGPPGTTPQASASATPKQTPTPAPTSAGPTPTPSPTSTQSASEPTPVVGAFGPLPPGNMASGSATGQTLDLTYHLNMSKSAIPSSAPAYQLSPRQWTQSEVAGIASSLSIGGDITSQGSNAYSASGNGGSLFVSGDTLQYSGKGAATPTTGSLPAAEVLVQQARQWLVNHQILTSNVGNGYVSNENSSSAQATVVIQPANPSNILGLTPSASVTLDSGGNVLQANVQWPAGLTPSNYGFRSASSLWDDVTGGRGFVQVGQGAPSGTLTGDVSITSASVAYTSATGQGGQQYLVPLVVFTGQGDFKGTSVAISVYVPAVNAQLSPRG